MTTEYGDICIQSETSNNSTVFTNSGNYSTVITANNGIEHSTDLAKFGSSSIKTNSGYLNVTFENFALDRKFQIDFWVYLTSYNTYIIYNSPYYNLFVDSNGDLTLSWFNYKISNVQQPAQTLTLLQSSGKYIPLNTWTHIYVGTSSTQTLSQYGTNLAFYLNIGINGVITRGIDYINTIYSVSTVTLNNINVGYNGYYEEINFIFDENLINTDFTPNSVPYGYIPPEETTYKIIGYVKKNSVAYANAIIRAYNRDTGILTTSTTSNNDGYYELTGFETQDTQYIICLDSLSASNYNSLILDRKIPQ